MILGMGSGVRAALFSILGAVALVGGAVGPLPTAALAQVQQVDPDRAIDGDLAAPKDVPSPAPTAQPPAEARPLDAATQPEPQAASAPADAANAAAKSATYQKEDLIDAAERTFGKGAAGLAGLIEDLLRKQGEPNAYITGREGGGALILGLRYGAGTMSHKVEGERKVYWTGPSVGIDVGANAGSTFVLVYNLYNTEEIFQRFAAAEGQAYLLGGFNVSYLRHEDKVLIPIRMGVGLRLGVNAGYMKFSKKRKWSPF